MEVCVDCISSARNAEAGGASRLELCSSLSEGGLTPSVGLLKVVKSIIKIPVFVMIRPRRGLDFVYSDEEVDSMEIDIESLKQAGADGFVFGALTSTIPRKVHEEICTRLLKTASPLPCTFHRAFDLVTYPHKALETIIFLGFQRILTSGMRRKASEGVECIKQLVIASKHRIVIMPGAGITEENLEFILRKTGVTEFHASARSRFDTLNMTNVVSMGAGDSDFSLMITDKNLVENMVKISKRSWKY